MLAVTAAFFLCLVLGTLPSVKAVRRRLDGWRRGKLLRATLPRWALLNAGAKHEALAMIGVYGLTPTSPAIDRLLMDVVRGTSGDDLGILAMELACALDVLDARPLGPTAVQGSAR